MSMATFSIDSPSEAAQLKLYEWLRNDCHALEQGSVQALLDLSCTDNSIRQALTELVSQPPRYLYRDHYAGEGLERVDPWLLEIPMEPAPIAALCQLCAGHPMLGFIVTTSSGDALLQHLRRQWEARDPQGNLYLLRWADTRCLPALYGCLDAPQRARLLQGIGSWIYFGRNGTPERIRPDAGAPPAKEQTTPFQLTAEQVQALHRATWPDALLALMAGRPQLYGQMAGLPSQRHVAACEALACLDSSTATAEALRAMTNGLKSHGLLQD